VFESDIEKIAAAGITLGCNPPTNDRFCPEDRVTRGEMAAFISRTLGLTGVGIDRFVDDDTSVFESDIERIAAAGVTLGCNPPTNDRYCPAGNVTRGEMAAFVSRALGLDGSNTDRFSDDDDSVFETDIERFAAAGITLGCNPPSNDRFCPEDEVTRGQMAAFLGRALDRIESAPLGGLRRRLGPSVLTMDLVSYVISEPIETAPAAPVAAPVDSELTFFCQLAL
jgi:hypothetical protein